MAAQSPPPSPTSLSSLHLDQPLTSSSSLSSTSPKIANSPQSFKAYINFLNRIYVPNLTTNTLAITPSLPQTSTTLQEINVLEVGAGNRSISKALLTQRMSTPSSPSPSPSPKVEVEVHLERCKCGCLPPIRSMFEMAELRKKHRENEKLKKIEATKVGFGMGGGGMFCLPVTDEIVVKPLPITDIAQSLTDINSYLILDPKQCDACTNATSSTYTGYDKIKHCRIEFSQSLLEWAASSSNSDSLAAELRDLLNTNEKERSNGKQSKLNPPKRAIPSDLVFGVNRAPWALPLLSPSTIDVVEFNTADHIIFAPEPLTTEALNTAETDITSDVLELKNRLAKTNVVLSFHPCQVILQIIESCLLNGMAFAVVPCCYTAPASTNNSGGEAGESKHEIMIKSLLELDDRLIRGDLRDYCIDESGENEEKSAGSVAWEWWDVIYFYRSSLSSSISSSSSSAVIPEKEKAAAEEEEDPFWNIALTNQPNKEELSKFAVQDYDDFKAQKDAEKSSLKLGSKNKSIDLDFSHDDGNDSDSECENQTNETQKRITFTSIQNPRKLQITVNQLLTSGVLSTIGGELWEASYLLSCYMLNNTLMLTMDDMRVLELGSGLGLVGLLVARLFWEGNNGGRVTLTDYSDVLLNNLKRNVKVNVAKGGIREGIVSVKRLDWYDYEFDNVGSGAVGGGEEEDDEVYDLIIGSALIYSPSHACCADVIHHYLLKHKHLHQKQQRRQAKCIVLQITDRPGFKESFLPRLDKLKLSYTIEKVERCVVEMAGEVMGRKINGDENAAHFGVVSIWLGSKGGE